MSIAVMLICQETGETSEGRLLQARSENLLTVIGRIKRRGNESISDINNPVICHHNGGPTAVVDSRYTALSDRLRFFEDRRFTVVSKKREVTFRFLLCGRPRAREDLRTGFARHGFLIGVFVNPSRHGAIGQPYKPKDSQPD
jgi:hypothetical protein